MCVWGGGFSLDDCLRGRVHLLDTGQVKFNLSCGEYHPFLFRRPCSVTTLPQFILTLQESYTLNVGISNTVCG